MNGPDEAAVSFLVDSGRCDHTTTIKTVCSGKTIGIEITSSCRKVRAYADALPEVGLREIAEPILNNPIYVVASDILGPECVVPCALVSATWTAAGMVSRNLLAKYPSMGFVYQEG